jgi:ferrous iron transport protein B
LDNKPHIGLLGNPNSGKTSLFNAMTGLNQQVGNFPGVTVEKKEGGSRLTLTKGFSVTDLPGSYSLYPRRADEWVSYQALMNAKGSGFDIYIVVTDASNLSRNLLYVSQVVDLGKPVVVALTMLDICAARGIAIDIPKLSTILGVPVVGVNPRTSEGMAGLDAVIHQIEVSSPELQRTPFLTQVPVPAEAVGKLQTLIPGLTPYGTVHYLINHEQFSLTSKEQIAIEQLEKEYDINHTRIQGQDIKERYARIREVVSEVVGERTVIGQRKSLSERLDDVFLHRLWGVWVMLAVLFLMFQSVFWLAEYPMNLIEYGFALVSNWVSNHLPDHWASRLLVDGVIAGLGGIMVFIPQIMILFGMITFFEDTGYMARISFLTDRFMRKVGLNGKSVMPMISGFACAVPAIMSARNIENRKERLLTILTTPLMSCSARIPVYTILISLVIPKVTLLGFLSLQGLVMMGLYMLGFVLALVFSAVFHVLIRIQERSYFILELPLYRQPRWKNIGVTMVQKARIFVLDAGKVIMVISLILWGLSSYGPQGNRKRIEAEYIEAVELEPQRQEELLNSRNARLLEESYAGILGKGIEPFIAPLGFDWKIGIALVTSFAAREVFVGTMATLYSVGEGADEHSSTLRDKMQAAVRSDGTPVYTLGTGISLMVFYVLAMQCMSTLAVVKRETGSWKWPVIQFIYMTVLAYVCSMIAYMIF